MTLDVLGRLPGGSIRAIINGSQVDVPDDLENSDRQLIAGWEADGNVVPDLALPIPPEVTIVFAVDLWSRLTNAEADAVEAAMATQSVRVQNIFRSASSYRSDHELWPLLESMATSLFGAERAAEILAAS